jgi:hypothetical protein
VLLRLARRAIIAAYGVTANSLVLARAAAFWTAVVLPFVFLGMLARGSPVLADPVTVGLFVATNVAALYVGHGHGTPSPEDDRTRPPPPPQSTEGLQDD